MEKENENIDDNSTLSTAEIPAAKTPDSKSQFEEFFDVVDDREELSELERYLTLRVPEVKDDGKLTVFIFFSICTPTMLIISYYFCMQKRKSDIRFKNRKILVNWALISSSWDL